MSLEVAVIGGLGIYTLTSLGLGFKFYDIYKQQRIEREEKERFDKEKPLQLIQTKDPFNLIRKSGLMILAYTFIFNGIIGLIGTLFSTGLIVVINNISGDYDQLIGRINTIETGFLVFFTIIMSYLLVLALIASTTGALIYAQGKFKGTSNRSKR